MEEIPIPLVRRLGGPASSASGGARPASSRPRTPPSGRNPTPPQFSFGAAHVRSAIERAAAEGESGPSSEDADLDAATIAVAGRANGSERAPASVRHTPRLLSDGAGGLGPSVSFPSTPPSSARRPSERAPASSRLDPALSAMPPQSLVPSTELAPPRLPQMAIGPVTAHAVLEWGPASDAFARGLGAAITEADPAAEPMARDTIVGAAPLATIPAGSPVERIEVDAAPPEPEEHELEAAPAAVEDQVAPPPDSSLPEEQIAREDASPWEERTDTFGYDDFPRSPDSNTRFIDRSPEDVLPEALDTLSGALDRDELIAALIEVATMVAERVGVFVVKKDGFHGWACNEAFGDSAALKTVRIPSKVPNILATATAAGFYLGPVPHTPGHQDLLAVMGNIDREVSVNVATVATRPVLVLVSDGFGDTLRTTKVLGEMMRVAGLTLARLLQMR